MVYEIDQNGLLHVTQVEVENGNSASIAIQYDGFPHKDVSIKFETSFYSCFITLGKYRRYCCRSEEK